MRAKKVIFFIKLFTCVLVILLAINFISGYFSERVKLYVKQKATTHASMVIANAINEEVLPNINLDNLFQTVSSDNQKIDSIYINTYQVNDILSKTTLSITNHLNNLDSDDLNTIGLPLGIIISDVLFYEKGPNINIKIYPVGAVVADVKSVVEEYGINNSIFKLEIEVKVSFAVVIPLQKEEVDVTTSIPIVVQIIQGDVPRFYFNGGVNGIIPKS